MRRARSQAAVRSVASMAIALALCSLTVCSRALGAEPAASEPGASEVPDATPATVQLDYRREPAAASCASAQQLARDVEARLGRRVFVGAAEAELVARVRAGRVAGRFRVELELFDRAGRSLGRRELSTRAAHCSSLDDSLALVLALAADTQRAPATPSPDPIAPGSNPPSSALALPAPSLGTPLSIPATTHAPRLGLLLRPSLGAIAAVGVVPSLAPGLELGFELRMNQFWPIRLHAAGLAEQRHAASAPPKAATFTAQTFSFGVCPWTGAVGGFEAAVCAVQCLGRIRSRGVGFDEEQRHDGWVLSAGAALSLSHAFGPLFVAASAAPLVSLLRRRYFFTDGVDITLYQQPWLGGQIALRVGTEI